MPSLENPTFRFQDGKNHHEGIRIVLENDLLEFCVFEARDDAEQNFAVGATVATKGFERGDTSAHLMEDFAPCLFKGTRDDHHTVVGFEPVQHIIDGFRRSHVGEHRIKGWLHAEE